MEAAGEAAGASGGGAGAAGGGAGTGGLPEVDYEAGEGEEAGAGAGAGGGGALAARPRFFLAKALSFPSLARSQAVGAWAVSAATAEKLAPAFESCSGGDAHLQEEGAGASLPAPGSRPGAVYLCFTVNLSGHFQGLARVTGPVRELNLDVFPRGNTAVPSQHFFPVEWEVVCDLPHAEVAGLKNSLNGGKPVKAGKDGQELEAGAGQELARAMVSEAERAERPRPAPPTEALDLCVTAAQAAPRPVSPIGDGQAGQGTRAGDRDGDLGDPRREVGSPEGAVEQAQGGGQDAPLEEGLPLQLGQMSYKEYLALFAKIKAIHTDAAASLVGAELMAGGREVPRFAREVGLLGLNEDDFLVYCRAFSAAVGLQETDEGILRAFYREQRLVHRPNKARKLQMQGGLAAGMLGPRQ